MRQHRDERIAHRADDAAGHVGFGKRESGMDRGDDVIEFRENVVGKIERTVAENIALHSSKESEIFVFLVEFPDPCELHSQARRIESVRLD